MLLFGPSSAVVIINESDLQNDKYGKFLKGNYLYKIRKIVVIGKKAAS